MKKLGKILGFALLGIFVLVLALAFAITHWLDPNDYKEDLRQLARDKANIVLALNGPIGWSFFPRLGLTLRDVSVASATTPDSPLAQAQTLALSMRWLPLLQKTLQMNGVRLDGLNLTLVRDADGHGNWEGLGPSSSPEHSKAEAPEKKSAAPMAFNIDSISITHGQASYHDLGQDRRFALTELSLTTDAVGSNQAVPLTFSGRFNGDGLDANASLDTVLHFDPEAQRYQLENLKLAGEIGGQSLEGKMLPFSLEGPLTADLGLGAIEAPSLKLAIGDVRADTHLKISDFHQTPQFDGTLTVAPFNLRAFLEAAGKKPPPMADNAALTKLALQTRITGNSDSVRFSDLRATVDETTLTGSLSAGPFSQPVWRLSLKGDRLNADRYLPPPAQATAKTGKPTAPTPQQPLWSSEPLLPLATLRTLAFETDVTLDALTLRQHHINDVATKIHAKEGVLTLDTLTAALLAGRLAAQGRLDARQDTPQIALQAKINGFAIDKFLEAKNDGPAPLRGKLNLDSRLTTAGNSQQAWIDHLNGGADFVITDAVLPGFNVEQQACRAIALVNRKTLTSEYDGKDTVFHAFKGTWKLTNGIADNRDFKADTSGLEVNGRGQLDLRTLAIDYRLGVVLEGDQRAMPDPACQINKTYAGIAWPVRCQGTLTQTPTAKLCGVDSERLTEIAAQLAGSKLLEKLDKKRDGLLEDKAPANLKDALKGLFKR